MKLLLTEGQVEDLFNKIKSSDPLRISDADFSRLEPIIQKIIKYFYEKSDVNTKPDDSFSKFEPISKPKYVKPSTKLGLKLNNLIQPEKNIVKTSKGNELMHPLGGKGRITSHFGWRNTKVGSRNHKGVDIGVPSGSPVYAPLDGYVLASRDTTPNGCGGFIKLDHGEIQTKYCHLRKMVVRQGQEVKKGQIIGYSGGGKNDPMRGTATGPHLHYEILNKSGIAMNPTITQSNLA